MAILATSGSLPVTSCSTAAQKASSPNTITNASGHIELFVRSEWQPQFTQLIKNFQEKHPRITVSLSTDPFSTYATRLLTLFASGNPPDVTEMVDVDFYEFASKGLFIDLTDYIRQDPDLSLDAPGYGQFYTSITDFFKSGKSIFAIPGSVNPFGIGYNVDMFKTAEVPTPYEQWKSGKWTWDAFVHTAQQMTRKFNGKKVYGYCDFANIWNIATRIWQNGGEILNREKTQVLVDRSAAYDAIQWYFDLYLKHKVAPVSLRSPDAVGMNRFAAQEVAMFDGNPGARAGLKSVPFEWGVAPQPKQREYASWTGGFGYAITKASNNPDAAWEFIRYASSATESEYLMRAGALTGSANIKAMHSSAFLHTPPDHVSTFLDMLKSAQPQPFIAQNEKFLEIWNNQMDLVAIGRKSAKSAAVTIKQQVQPLLSP